MPGNHPKESIQHSVHGESLKSRNHDILHSPKTIPQTKVCSSKANKNTKYQILTASGASITARQI